MEQIREDARNTATNSFLYVPFLCAVANRPHLSIQALQEHIPLWNTWKLRLRHMLQQLNVNFETLPWQQNNYLSATVQEQLLERIHGDFEIGQFLVQEAQRIRQGQ